MLYTSEKLLTAHSLKEKFNDFMNSKNSIEAKKKLSSWILAAQDSGLDKFIACANTMVRWSVGILNSFDCPYTNGFTENVNNKIKVLKRNAYGFRNFKRFRNHILHIFAHKNENISDTA
jgi:transposase